MTFIPQRKMILAGCPWSFTLLQGLLTEQANFPLALGLAQACRAESICQCSSETTTNTETRVWLGAPSLLFIHPKTPSLTDTRMSISFSPNPDTNVFVHGVTVANTCLVRDLDRYDGTGGPTILYPRSWPRGSSTLASSIDNLTPNNTTEQFYQSSSICCPGPRAPV